MKHIRLFLLIISGILFFTACQESEDEKNEPSVPEDSVPDKLTIEPESVTLEVGESCQLIAKLNGVPLEGNEVRWTPNSSLLSVDDNGKVTAVSYDEFVSGLSVKATIQEGQLYATCKITVYKSYNYKLRLILKDKGHADYSLNQPEKFLSVRAIDRRRKRNIAIDDLDLPISKDYLKQIEKVGGKIVSQSKWLKTVCVQCDDEALIDEYEKLPFVEDVIKVWRGEKKKRLQNIPAINNSFMTGNISDYSIEDYGDALGNIILHNGQILHERGFKGDGIEIAVIDAGFVNILENPALSDIRIKGAKSFLYEDSNPYNTDEHGIGVTACMATNKPGYYIGSAPEAGYWLLRSEDAISGDYPAEEDYWTAAIEYADSAGVDMVNTSLSYIQNEWPFPSHKFEEMDGKTAMPTRAANIAAGKGIFIVCCAGNNGSWVGTPADSPNVLTVGSVAATGSIGPFTAYGMTVDGRMKPDVVALGSGVHTIDTEGSIVLRSGTSYASPILCGLIACLWQAYPWATNQDLLNVIKKSSDRYDSPMLPYGYGIVNIQKAIDLLDSMQNKR